MHLRTRADGEAIAGCLDLCKALADEALDCAATAGDAWGVAGLGDRFVLAGSITTLDRDAPRGTAGAWSGHRRGCLVFPR